LIFREGYYTGAVFRRAYNRFVGFLGFAKWCGFAAFFFSLSVRLPFPPPDAGTARDNPCFQFIGAVVDAAADFDGLGGEFAAAPHSLV
jgi:hypothetical protein